MIELVKGLDLAEGGKRTEETSLRTITIEELAEYDGTDGQPAYVGYRGKVYDVSAGPNWTAGAHYEHIAGDDLTDVMDDAPHGDEVIEAFPVVGILEP